MTQPWSQNTSLWVYLLTVPPLTLNCVSCSTLIREFTDLHVGGRSRKLGDDKRNRWEEMWGGRDVFAGDLSSLGCSMSVIVAGEEEGRGEKQFWEGRCSVISSRSQIYLDSLVDRRLRSCESDQTSHPDDGKSCLFCQETMYEITNSDVHLC